MSVVRTAWGAAVFLALLAGAAWVAFDAWQGQPRRPEWLRIGIAVLLALGILGLLNCAVQALRGKRREPFSVLVRDSVGSTALSVISLWAFWHVFLWVQRPGVQRIAEPIAGAFGKRIGFWLFWIVVVPFAAVVLLLLCNRVFHLLAKPFRAKEEAEEEPAAPAQAK